MTYTMLKSKIHRGIVTEANLNYTGSITIDRTLMNAAGILEYEKVQVVNVNNGSRIETYAICGDEDSGVICMNGAAARCAEKGDIVIIMAYAQMDASEAENYNPTVVLAGENNKIDKVFKYERNMM